MERKVLLVCTVVAFLGILSAVLGFAAEATKAKIATLALIISLQDADVQKIGPAGCIHPRTPAFALGLAAVLALTIAQAIINTVAGCICCKKHHYSSSTNCAIALVSLIISWLTFIFAFLLLLAGAALGDDRGRQWLHIADQCSFLESGVLSGGAALSLATVSFGIIYYIKTHVEPREAQQNQGIAMGQPQIPQQSTQPVFVHEDTNASSSHENSMLKK
ncbi:hypothetical protein Taro_051096 [Colocasia esculenta]|uniref:Transmembrane protein n=1 Tax=Colocasia esculenta TaxID=4460 RepID=A0A843XFS3_COLES|nr:hypothetical protein [Colocasia esculenta]